MLTILLTKCKKMDKQILQSHYIMHIREISSIKDYKKKDLQL